MAFLSQISDFDTAQVGLLQRLFLVTDGTLTDLVEAAFLEPVALRKVAVVTSHAPEAIAELEVEPGEMIMTRQILIYGTSTDTNYVYAESLLAIDRLPEDFRRALVESDAPMGRLWSDHRLETWKELLKVHRVAASGLSDFFKSQPNSGLLSRTYRLVSGGRPLMLISEYFPEIYGVVPS